MTNITNCNHIFVTNVTAFNHVSIMNEVMKLTKMKRVAAVAVAAEPMPQ